MPFHHYRPLKNPRVDAKFFKKDLEPGEDFEIPLSGRAAYTTGLGGGFLDAVCSTPLHNVVKKMRKNEKLDFENTKKWLWKGKVRQFIMNTPGFMIQNIGVAAAIRGQKNGVNRKLTPIEYLSTATVGGFCSAFWTAPIDLLRAKQKATKKYLLQTSREVFENSGVIGIYRGFLFSVLKDSVFCMGWMGVIPLMHVALRNRSDWCDDHPLITSAPFVVFAATAVSAVQLPLHHAKEMGLSYPRDVERGTIKFWLNDMKTNNTLHVGLYPMVARLSVTFFILHNFRMKMIAFRSERKLCAHPYIIRHDAKPPDMRWGFGFGGTYDRDLEDPNPLGRSGRFHV